MTLAMTITPLIPAPYEREVRNLESVIRAYESDYSNIGRDIVVSAKTRLRAIHELPAVKAAMSAAGALEVIVARHHRKMGV